MILYILLRFSFYLAEKEATPPLVYHVGKALGWAARPKVASAFKKDRPRSVMALSLTPRNRAQ